MGNHLRKEDLVWMAIKEAKENEEKRKIQEKVDERVEKLLKRKREVSNDEVHALEQKAYSEEYDRVHKKESVENIIREAEIQNHLNECFYCRNEYNLLKGIH